MGTLPTPSDRASRPWPWRGSSRGWHRFHVQVTGWTRPQHWKAVPRGVTLGLSCPCILGLWEPQAWPKTPG